MELQGNSLKDVNLKIAYASKWWSIEWFYIPALSCAHRYDRISGFFSSTSLAIAARGISGLIKIKENASYYMSAI